MIVSKKLQIKLNRKIIKIVAKKVNLRKPLNYKKAPFVVILP